MATWHLEEAERLLMVLVHEAKERQGIVLPVVNCRTRGKRRVGSLPQMKFGCLRKALLGGAPKNCAWSGGKSFYFFLPNWHSDYRVHFWCLFLPQPCSEPCYDNCSTAKFWSLNRFWFFGREQGKMDNRDVSFLSGHYAKYWDPTKYAT